MKQFLFAVSVIAVVILFAQTSCFYDNEVEQYANAVCDTAAVSYSQDIQPIIQDNCVSCHGPGGQQEQSSFHTYDGLKIYTFNREIVDRVYGNGVNLMPPSGPLSDCNKLKIAAWVDAGALNN